MIYTLPWVLPVGGNRGGPVQDINDERTERTKRTQEKARNPAMEHCRLASGQDEC